jgi:glycosyltransferase involved in cell wall biosynthesis
MREPVRRPVRIAHILPWPSVGGTEAATVRLAQAIEGDEFSSVAFCLRGAAPVRALFEEAGIPVIEYEAVEPSLRRPSRFVRSSVVLARQLRAADVSLVHAADLLAAHRSSLAALLARVPLVTHVRGRFPALSRRDRLFLLPVRRFVFVARDTWRVFGHHVPDDRGEVLYDGIDVRRDVDVAGADVREELDIAASARVIGMVARVAPAKDYDTLIRAAAIVVARHPDAMFLIVGQHSGVREYERHYEYVRRLIDEHALARHFVFTDHRTDVGRLLDAMDVCVLATHGEGLPLGLLEAMAKGKPVVATAVGGIPELVRHEETGLLVPPSSDDALARELSRLLDDPAYARALGESGRAFVERAFGRSSFAARLRALYTGVLTRRR